MINRAINGNKPTNEDLDILREHLAEQVKFKEYQLENDSFGFTPSSKNDVERYIIMEDVDDFFYANPIGLIYSWVYFVWSMAIRQCKREKCNNFFAPLQKGAKRLYCSRSCAKKARSENACEETRKEAKDVHRKLCDLIDKWVGRRNSVNVKASELKDYLKEIAECEAIIDTPFLKGNYNHAKSLGQYLRYIKEMLENEYGIKCKPDKEGSEYAYCFVRIQS